MEEDLGARVEKGLPKGSHLYSETLLLKGPEPRVVLFIKRYPN